MLWIAYVICKLMHHPTVFYSTKTLRKYIFQWSNFTKIRPLFIEISLPCPKFIALIKIICCLHLNFNFLGIYFLLKNFIVCYVSIQNVKKKSLSLLFQRGLSKKCPNLMFFNMKFLNLILVVTLTAFSSLSLNKL